ncbi:uncharacterized protein LOC131928191 [Physella acuta]|uniref:uncharacterized protein LOC131928191 n=1 Tax=Physella acuta TaxID=109671 RepID=UPI0027DC9FF9|nr:uncharacterized protein LOC131928191 [Physella acuta]
MVDPQSGTSEMYKCLNGLWTSYHIRNRREANTTALVRRARASYYVYQTSCRTVCDCGWWHRRCHTHCWTNRFINNYPTIYCPSIPDVTVTNAVYARVYWSDATAYDIEDGYIRPRLTSWPRSGSLFYLGTYIVTYEAKDRYGATAYCTSRFTVSYRRCYYYDSYGVGVYSIPNGYVSCASYPYLRFIFFYIYGESCTYSCYPGYILQGSSSISCTLNGRWSALRPSCVPRPVCPALKAVPNGQWSAYSMTSGSVAYLYCRDGYTVDGPSYVTCLSNGVWSVAGSCRDIQPPVLKCPSTITAVSKPKKQPVSVSWGSWTVSDNSNEFVTVSSSAVSGQLFPVGQTVVSVQATDRSGNIASCAFVVYVTLNTCPAVSVPDQAKVSCSHDNAVGSDCVFSCAEGFQLTGATALSCLETGKWENKTTSCQRALCSKPPAVLNGEVNCPNNTYTFGVICPVTCYRGYQIQGSTSVVCLSNTTWTSPGSCRDIEPPTIISCTNVSVFAEQLGYSTYVSFTGLVKATDTTNTTIDISYLPASNTAFSIGTTQVKATVSDLAGNRAYCNFTVTVTALLCQNPAYSGLEENGTSLMVFNCPQGYVYGATCNITCSNGNAVTGSPSIFCRKNETLPGTGYWDYGNAKPVCDSKFCSKQEAPTFGAVACDVINQQEVCAVQCKQNYTLTAGSPQNGVYVCWRKTGEWLPSIILKSTCIASSTPYIETTPNIQYYSTSCATSTEEIKTKFFTLIQGSDVFKDVCTTVTCNITDVTVTCGSRSRRSVDDQMIYTSSSNTSALDRDIRDTSTATHMTKVMFRVKIAYKDQGSAAKTLLFFDNLIYDLNVNLDTMTASGTFNIPEAGETNPYSYGFGDMNFVCPENTVFIYQTALCAGCGKGNIYNRTTKTCAACPAGTYQPNDAASECLNCTAGATTTKSNSTSANDCLDVCDAGSYSSTGLKPCEVCTRGTYQPLVGRKGCDTCPFGMSTLGSGSTSKADCKFYSVVLGNTSLEVDMDKTNGPIKNFTMVFWAYIPQDLVGNTTSTFTLASNVGGAMIGCKDFLISIASEELPIKRIKKSWYHLAVTHSGNKTSLFVDGQLIEQKTTAGLVNCTDFKLLFTRSARIPELTVSGMQLSRTELSQSSVTLFAHSCGLILDGNIFLAPENTAPLLTPSFCDDNNVCLTKPCGDHGVCSDLANGFKCECDELWTGNTCQIPPDFCVGNLCRNKTECVSQVLSKNYTCSCQEGYKGLFCTDKIVNGGWASWTQWSVCPVTCGGGVTSRYRTCNNPSPDPSGLPCSGNASETKACYEDHCPVNGGLSAWSGWSCDVECGQGTASRTRSCNNPAPLYGGLNCSGQLNETKSCDNITACPINGGFGPWSDWSTCTKTCGTGVTTRYRNCDSPEPQYGGNNCSETGFTESAQCNNNTCPVCSKLYRQTHMQDIACKTNTTTDMTECKIVCIAGYITDLSIVYKCGRLSNYTWSHITPENPRGLLPDCTAAVSVTERSISQNAEITAPTSSGTIETQVAENINKTINSSCTTCELSVTSNTSNTSISRKKKSTTGKFIISYTMYVRSPLIESTTATDDETELVRQKLLEFEQVAQLIYNNSANIFTVMVDGIEYRGKVNSTVAVSEKCPEGTTLLLAVCAYCVPGSYWKNDQCLLCPIGTYQEQFGMTYCESCPAGTSTAGLGSQSITHCVDDPSIYYDCSLGYWADDENGPCKEKQGLPNENLGLIVGSTLGGTAIIVLLILAFMFRKAILSKFQTQVIPDKPPPYSFLEQPPPYFVKRPSEEIHLDKSPRPLTSQDVVLTDI